MRGRSLLAAAVALLAACGAPSPPLDVLARIDGDPVAYAEFESYLETHSVDPDEGWGSDLLSALLDQFLDEALLARLAAAEGVAASEPRRAVDELVARRLGAAVSDAEVEAYYRRRHDEFARPERVRLRQILVEDAARLQRVEAALAAGEPFAEVAERLSQVPAGSLGGEELLAREDLPPAFADAVFALAEGTVSAPIRTDYGIHLFELVERRPAETVSLAAVAGDIRERLRRERAGQALQRLLGEARARYDVDLFERNLPFNYQGAYGDLEAVDRIAPAAGGGAADG